MAPPRPPPTAALLTAVGGGLIAVAAFLEERTPGAVPRLFGVPAAGSVGGLVAGVAAALAGVLMLTTPPSRRSLGVVALACAVASVPLAFGGFVVGFVLVAVGGAMPFARPRPEMAVVPSPSATGRSPPWT